MMIVCVRVRECMPACVRARVLVCVYGAVPLRLECRLVDREIAGLMPSCCCCFLKQGTLLILLWPSVLMEPDNQSWGKSSACFAMVEVQVGSSMRHV